MAFLLDKDLIIVLCIIGYVLAGFLTASIMVKYRLENMDADDFLPIMLFWWMFVIVGLPVMFCNHVVSNPWKAYMRFLEKDHYK